MAAPCDVAEIGDAAAMAAAIADGVDDGRAPGIVWYKWQQ